MLTDIVQGMVDKDLKWLIETAREEVDRRRLKGYDRVHVYAVTKVEVPMVEANNHQEAIERARKMVNLHKAIDRGTEYGKVEYTGETLGYLVDEMDDPIFERSAFYCPDGKKEMERAPGSFPRILVCVEGGILQGFISDSSNLKVALYDGDIKGLEPERIIEIDGKEALATFIPIDRRDEDLEFLNTVFTALERKQ